MTNDKIDDAYEPPDVTPPTVAESQKRKGQLALVGLRMSVIAMVAATLIAGLAIVGIIPVAWDSALVPGLVLFICVPLSVIGGIISGIALILRPSWVAGMGILLGCLATVISLGSTWMLAMLGLAHHPV